MTGRDQSGRQAGFTLIETLAAMALMGLIMSALASITSQWLPNWNRGFDRVQRSEAVGIALDRISADIAAAEYMRPDRQSRNVVFDGQESSVTFARTSVGPNAVQGLDLVRIGEAVDRDGIALARARAAFAPGGQVDFTDPVVLLRAPYRVSFSYAGSNRIWKTAWRDAQTLPSAVMVTLHATAAASALSISRVAVLHISESAESLCARVEGSCGARPYPSRNNGQGTPAGAGQ